MKAKHPDLYQEAEQLYEQLNEKYPEKRDLTKTSEFLIYTTQYSTFTDLYRDRYKKKKATPKEKVTPETQASTEMVLEIPLMSSDDVNKTTYRQEDDDQPFCIPEDTYNMLVDELRRDPDLHNVFKDMTDNTLRHQQDVDEIIRQFGLTQADQSCVENPMSRQLDELMGEIADILPELEEGLTQADQSSVESPMSRQLDELRDEIDDVLPEPEEQSRLENELELLGW